MQTSRRRPRPGTPDTAPVYAVWELTRRCDQACAHCGSRAGLPQADELDTAGVLDVVAQLAELGCREVTLIGGEAYLRPDLDEIIQALVQAGVFVSVLTGGRALDEAMVRHLASVGLGQLAVSVDGLQETHERMRRVPGGYALALGALDAGVAAGLPVTANTQINRLNKHQLPEIAQVLHAHGVDCWQVQLTSPMGRAADAPDWLLQPWEVVEVIDALAEIQLRGPSAPGRPPFDIFAGDNIGYFGPNEVVLRSRPGRAPAHWGGCSGGKRVIGLESDGKVKPCLSMPTQDYCTGRLSERSLRQIWEEDPSILACRSQDPGQLWGFCGSCYYGAVCLAGCPSTSTSVLGRRGNNPFCYYRVTELARRGLRERLLRREPASGAPFDHGCFELIEEDLPPGA
ncbi:MAG: radical SAM protein [Proteobacteria bacterium]|nr:radical SAM protein [Pseudomonadota bacterium]MCP4917826.1 radical SAM protein [Pseudomonadota bacterium]